MARTQAGEGKVRIIGLCIIYNGEQFLDETLHNMTRRIRDLTHIVVFDGAWVDGGDSHISTDKTHEILQKFADENHNIEIIVGVHPSKLLWKNPSEKRNHALKRINELFNDDDYFVFWFDDDEEIRFRDGREEIWLRDHFKETDKDLFLLQTYGWNVEKGMQTVRFIRGGKGYHWHTERAMQFHDKDCNIITDWTPGMEINQNIQDVAQLFIVNKWNRRNVETLKRRDRYASIEYENAKKRLPCKYKEQSIIESVVNPW